MNLFARFSMANRALIALVTVVASIAGVYSVTQLKQELIPALEFPAVIVVSQYPGASADVVDAQVTQKVDSAAKSLEGVESIQSTSTPGSSIVMVTLDYGTDTAYARQRLESSLGSALAGLPDDVEPLVIAGSIADIPIVQLSVSGEGADLADLTSKVDEELVPLLDDIAGVRDVTVSGGPVDQVQLTIQPAALAAAKANVGDIATTLQQNGSLLPAGAVTDDTTTLSVQVGSELQDVKDIAALPLAGSPGTTLGDVARVRLAEKAATSISRTDGNPSIGLAITKTPDGNTVDISHAVADAVDEAGTALGEGTSVDVVFDQAPFIEKSIEDLTTEGLLGLVFAVVVILVFLASLRSTIVTAISIPLSLLVTFVGLLVFGYSLNILTLGAITVAIGRVVDDSIVVIENIKRHLSYGTRKSEAVLTGTREVASAITASTLATVAVFLPIGLVGGQVGELFRPFAFTVALAMLSSLLVALTIVPVLAYWFLRERQGEVDPVAVEAAAQEKERRTLLQRGYVPVIDWALRHRVITLVLAAVLFVGSMALTPFMKTNFLGNSGQNTFTVVQSLEPGASLAAIDTAAQKVEDALTSVDGVDTVQATIGSGDGLAALFGGGGDANFAVTTDEDADQEALQDEVSARLDELQDVGTVQISAAAAMGGSSTIDVVVTSDDPASLDDAAAQVLEALTDVDGASDVSSNAQAAQPTITVTLNQVGRTLGVSEQQISQAVSSLTGPTPLGSVVLTGAQTDVVVLPGGEVPTSVEELRRLPFGDATLGDVAEVEQVALPVSVTRQDGDRSITVSVTPEGDDLGTVNSSIAKAIDGVDLPEGAEATVGGVSADQAEAFAQLGIALLLAIAIVYIVMVATFKSLIQPFLLLVSIPFAATGAVLLLVITGVPLGVPSLIGMLMLIGIVVTNAIVLIDLVNQYRRQGASAEEAVREGSRHRVRPIVMTALATICALTPMALGVTGGSAFISQPLAIVVIGGLASSTLLTLILVPVLYLVVERWRTRKERRRARRAARATAV
ncbi:efflux RND transporter permease subunit [Aeromicrobium sp. HA]|uniref:efflux RND transporter permease subunit n=1 Tax=Aeromicrobium sp. HA TaxID=3009077 RepID=UPI0022AF6E07|nr:efflux RND transporter permease subunit [Aeromicrobium sp. HA]